MNLEELRNFDFRDLDVNNIGSWPQPVRIGTLVLIFALIAGLGWWYFIQDELDNLDQAQSKESSLKQEFARKQAKAANLDAYRKQLAEMRDSFGAMLRQLPGKTEVDNLLVDISQTALASGLQQELFKPESEQPKEFYAEKPIKMELTGSFHEFGQFASGVAALPRIVTLHDIHIEPAKQQQGAKGEAPKGPLVMAVTAKTYRYLDEEEQRAQESKNRKKKGGRR